jgi:hypothetical protein
MKETLFDRLKCLESQVAEIKKLINEEYLKEGAVYRRTSLCFEGSYYRVFITSNGCYTLIADADGNRWNAPLLKDEFLEMLSFKFEKV